MKRLRALLVATIAGSLLVAIRRRRRPPGAVVGGPLRHIHRWGESTPEPK